MKSFLFAIFAILLFTKCTETELTGPEISKQDNGKSVYFNSGADFNLLLDVNPSAGYSWNILAMDSSKIEYTGHSDFVYDEPIMPGSTAKCKYMFKTKKKGSSVLKLGYLRTWEKGIAPIDSFKIKININ